MYTEHLNSKLRAANIQPTNPRPQLLARAASQINTYVGMLNARLAASDNDNVDRDVVEILTQVQRISQLAKADPAS